MRKRYFFKRIMAAAAAIVMTVGISSGIYNPAYLAKAEETGENQPAQTAAPTENTDNGNSSNGAEVAQSEQSGTAAGANDWQNNPTMEGGEQNDFSRIDDSSEDEEYEVYDDSEDSEDDSDDSSKSSGKSDSSESSDSDSKGENDNSPAALAEYAQKLKSLAEQQAELDKQLKQADKDLKDQTAKTKALQKKIKSVDEQINVINGYMTALEIKINTNKRNIEEKKQQIKKGTEDFKQRLRAMYIAGSSSYATMVLESDSFYDALMRIELVKRVADHDNTAINNLVKLKKQYEQLQKELDTQQAEYEKQSKALDSTKKNLEELYNTNEDTRRQLARKKKALEQQNKDFQSQRSDFSGILKNSTGNTPRDQQVKATMALADERLKQLSENLVKRVENKEKIDEYECKYSFAWPVPQSYNITYGIGARWGAYHAGIDIGGDHGYSIRASESGTVLKVNTVCPHDYGKNGSCGCGGGYGKFIIIDHGNDFITLYGHLSEVDVSPGDKVKEGDEIGKMGSTGFSTGDHLHFEIRYQGYILNPAFYVDIK